MKTTAAWLAAVSTSLGVIFGATNAAAFCRTTTCDPATECDYDSRGCATVGLPLEWRTGCVSFSVQKDGSPKRNISYDKAHSVVTRAFDRWTGVSCNGKAMSLEVSDLSPAICSEPEYNSGNPNANVIMFRDTDWPYAGENATLALTTITFNFETGEIFDADIEVNSYKTGLTTSDTVVEFDLESIITHEAGHFLGLSHSSVSNATMFLKYDEGDLSLRDLHADDIDGICAAYPPDREITNADCRPRHGFSPDCRPPPDKGCSIGAAGTSPSLRGAWLLLFGLGVSGAVRRHRRLRPSAR